jgi:hypothetical protein
MSISDLVKSAIEGDASSFEEVFNNLMGEKTEFAIERKFSDMYESADEEEDDEDEEMEDDEDEEMEDDDEMEDEEDEDED